MLETGQTVDKYEVVSLLGEGGMAAVYLVRHNTLGSLHALKLLQTGARQVRERLMHEGRVQATLRHPNIVAVTDVLDIDGDPGLLMEYVDGPALQEWRTEHAPSLPDALALFRGVARGVRHAHKKGLVHRDLKPANVLLHRGEDGLVPKVTDFGLVKAVAGDGAGQGKTRTGMTMGTPGYMSPEQIRDASKVDERTDIYSLGCILYFLVTGRAPIEGDDIVQMFNAVVTGTYTPMEQYVPDVPPALVALVGRMLSVDRAKRPADVTEVLDTIDALGPIHASTRTSLAPMEIAPTLPTPVTREGADTTESRVPRRGLGVLLVGGGLLAAVSVLTCAGVALGFALWPTEPTEVAMGADAPDAPVVVQPPEAPAAEVEPTVALAVGTEAPPEPPGTAEVEPTEPARPVVAKDPKTPEPVPVAAPAPAPPTPVAPTAKPGRVTVEGDAAEVWLVADGQRVEAGGAVPPGVYDVVARFTDGEPAVAGRVTVAEGQAVTIKCVGFVRKCR